MEYPKVEKELFNVNNENLQKLASLFPSAVKDGQLDIEALKEFDKQKTKVFKYITEVQTPQGVLAVVEKKSNKYDIDYNDDIIVALDDVQDPGNLGTILRTVDSIGLNQIIVSKGTADCYNPKVVRSTMGAIFRIKIIECDDIEKTLKETQKNNFKLVVSSLQTKNSLYDINFDKKVIIIGNEANGVEQRIQDIADEKIKIPMLGKTESLNASVATGIILYEYVRQKIAK